MHFLLLGAPLQAAGAEGQDPVVLQAAQLCARGLQADHEGPRRRQGRRAEEDEDPEGRPTGTREISNVNAALRLDRRWEYKN